MNSPLAYSTYCKRWARSRKLLYWRFFVLLKKSKLWSNFTTRSISLSDRLRGGFCRIILMVVYLRMLSIAWPILSLISFFSLSVKSYMIDGCSLSFFGSSSNSSLIIGTSFAWCYTSSFFSIDLTVEESLSIFNKSSGLSYFSNCGSF